MAGMSPRKAKAARRLATGSGRAKSSIPGVPAPRTSGKPLSAREEKKVAKGDVKRSATRLKNNSGAFSEPLDRSVAAYKMNNSLDKAVSKGVSAKASGKAVDKGFKKADTRLSKTVKANTKATKKLVKKDAAIQKVRQKIKNAS